MELRPGNAQWIGRRAEQQDSFGFAGFTQDWHRGAGGVLVVLADGMGGMDAGGEASRLAVRTMMAAYGRREPGETIPDALSRALAETNRVVYEFACRGAGAGNTGTTLVAAAVQGGQCYWIAAGDSRLYLYRGADGSITQCTQDHNRRADLLLEVAQGRLSRAQAESDPDGAALTSFVGMAEVARLDSNVRPLPLAPGDRLLLASDGVHGVLGPAEIAAALARDAQGGADALIAAVKAKRRGNQDNATVAVIECRGDAPTARPLADPAPASRRRRWLLVALLLLTVLILGIVIGIGLGAWRPLLGPQPGQPPSVPAALPAAPTTMPVPETAPSGRVPEASAPATSPPETGTRPEATAKPPRQKDTPAGDKGPAQSPPRHQAQTGKPQGQDKPKPGQEPPPHGPTGQGQPAAPPTGPETQQP